MSGAMKFQNLWPWHRLAEGILEQAHRDLGYLRNGGAPIDWTHTARALEFDSAAAELRAWAVDGGLESLAGLVCNEEELEAALAHWGNLLG